MDKQYLFCICNKYSNFWSLNLGVDGGMEDLDPTPAVTLVQVTTEKV